VLAFSRHSCQDASNAQHVIAVTFFVVKGTGCSSSFDASINIVSCGIISINIPGKA
jgi:hypothetical protein